MNCETFHVSLAKFAFHSFGKAYNLIGLRITEPRIGAIAIYREHLNFAEKVSQCGLGVSPSRATGKPSARILVRSWGLPKGRNVPVRVLGSPQVEHLAKPEGRTRRVNPEGR